MSTELLLQLGAAFLGGIILNVMPCVLPVLTMKVFHLIDSGNMDARTNRRHGIFYTAGVVATFIAFAAIVIAIRAGGQRVGWGMQFTNPALIAALTGLMVLFGLNALGVFEFTVSVQGSHSDKDSYFGTFINGIVASVMATPCSAPFLGGAAAFALGAEASNWHTMAIFIFIGLGLAFPFAMISFVPALGKRLPRPGAWMETFKHAMGFSLLAAAVWLFGVFMGQVTTSASNWFLAFLLFMGVGLWAVDRFGGLIHSTQRRLGVRIAVVVLLVAGGIKMIDFTPKAKDNRPMLATTADVVVDNKINWAGFNPKRVRLAQRRDRPVFIDFTADWCANCKVQEKAVLETDPVRGALEDTGILPMKADLTNNDEEIWEWLEARGRTGIPAYAIYTPDGEVDLLPEIITRQMVIDRLRKASERFPRDKYKPLLEVAQTCIAQVCKK